MLYADFYFPIEGHDAVCVAGWTMGRLGRPCLVDEAGASRPASACLGFLRADLPAGAMAFLARFPQPDGAARLRLEAPERLAELTASTLADLISSGTDDVFAALLVALADGMIPLADTFLLAEVHKRAVALEPRRGFQETPGAAVAQDFALGFANPPRVMVNGWLGDDGTARQTRGLACVIDAEGLMTLELYRDALIRPDLAGAQVRALQLGAGSGFVGAARLPRALGPNPVCLVGLIQDGLAISTLRQVQPKGALEMGRSLDTLRRNIADTARAAEIVGHLLPDLPDYTRMDLAEHVDRPADPQGLAYAIGHDLDHWLARDVLRLVRKAGGDLVQIGLMTEGTSEGLIRACMADAAEAIGPGPRVELMGTNTALPRWAPAARHLVVTTSTLLFQVDVFPILARARAEGLPCLCLVLTDRIEGGLEAIPTDEGIAALLDGLPFASQLDQSLIEPVILPQSLHLSQLAQMRWLLVALAKAGSVTFVSASGLGFLPGRDPVPFETRQIELHAMRRTAEEIAL